MFPEANRCSCVKSEQALIRTDPEARWGIQHRPADPFITACRVTTGQNKKAGVCEPKRELLIIDHRWEAERPDRHSSQLVSNQNRFWSRYDLKTILILVPAPQSKIKHQKSWKNVFEMSTKTLNSLCGGNIWFCWPCCYEEFYIFIRFNILNFNFVSLLVTFIFVYNIFCIFKIKLKVKFF